jgi:Trypsin-like peptidase domain
MFVCCCSGNEAVEAILNATCRIQHKQSSGTCFLIEAPQKEGGTKPHIVLVTAAHFFEETTGPECQLMARAQQPNGDVVRREINLPIRANDQRLWKKHPDVDVAALRVTLPDDIAMKPLPFEQLASEPMLLERKIQVADEVYIPGYPAKLEGNGAGWPVLRKGIIASYPLVPLKTTKTILVHANTFGGDSGAPVATAEETARVVGLISGMHRQTDRATLPFEEHVNHTPLALAIVVQAPFIRETIELLDK